MLVSRLPSASVWVASQAVIGIVGRGRGLAADRLGDHTAMGVVGGSRGDAVGIVHPQDPAERIVVVVERPAG
jgi:hypothetical protein